MQQEKPRFKEIVMPALLRHARSTYGAAMRRALEEEGFSDLPRSAMYVIGGLALGAGDVPLGRLTQELGVSKQAAGQLVDTLVLRGYLERRVDEGDRRRLTIGLTARGEAAAAAQAVARLRIDAELLARVGAEDVARTRRTLAALRDMGRKAQVQDH